MIRPEGSSAPLGSLHDLDARHDRERVRGHLNRVMRAMGGNPGGVLFAALHGSYDPTTGTFDRHWHGVATGRMIDVVDGLRDLRVYAPAKPGDGRDAIRRPVWMSDQPLHSMPDPITYCLQRWWPLRETYVAADGLRSAYPGLRRRIRGEAEAEYLLFLDRCTLEDMILSINMHATAHGLRAR